MMAEEKVGMISEKHGTIVRQVVAISIIVIAGILGYGLLFGDKKPPEIRTESVVPQSAQGFARATRTKVETVVDQVREAAREKEPPPPMTDEELAQRKFENMQILPALKGRKNTFDDVESYLEKRRGEIHARTAVVVPEQGQTESGVVETARTNVLTDNWNRLLAGTKISGIVMEPINTTLPGTFMVQVQDDVYSAVGMQMLIPRGSRILGSYGTSVRRSQNRVLAMVTRLIIRRQEKPEAIVEVDIDSQVADVLGQSGIKGHLNTFFWERFANATLYALIGAGASLAEDDTRGGGGMGGSAREDYKGDITEAMADVAQDEVRDQERNYQSVIKVKAGEKVIISLTRDIIFREMPRKTPMTERY